MSTCFSGVHLTILTNTLELRKHPIERRLSGHLIELRIH